MAKLMESEPLDNVARKHQDRLLAAASRYVQSQRSDPFAGRRVFTHLKNGIGIGFDKDGNPNSYDADKVLETRSVQKSDGTSEEYKVEVYNNVQRP